VYCGARITGSAGAWEDLANADALWEDQPVVVDRHFVSSRKERRPPRLLPRDHRRAERKIVRTRELSEPPIPATLHLSLARTSADWRSSSGAFSTPLVWFSTKFFQNFIEVGRALW
jgi:hypothetical protein